MTQVVEMLTKILAMVIKALAEAGAGPEQIRKAMQADPTIRTTDTEDVLAAIAEAWPDPNPKDGD